MSKLPRKTIKTKKIDKTYTYSVTSHTNININININKVQGDPLLPEMDFPVQQKKSSSRRRR